MDPLNKQERTEAFIKMLALFLLAVIIVAIPMYYAFQMPERENTLNQDKFNELVTQKEKTNKFEQQFLSKTDSAISLLNAYKNEEDELLRDKIQLRYSEVTNQLEDYLDELEEDTIKSQLFDNLVYTYNNLFSTVVEKNNLQAELDECLQTSQIKSREITKKEEIVAKEREKSIQEKEIDLIKKALNKHNGSKRLAAKELGTTERKLRKRMKELGMID